MASRGKNFIIIGDPHAHPDYDNDRFHKLGKLIQKVKPDYVVCMGDFADMCSLSMYDATKVSAEGRRYTKDIDVTHDALGILKSYTKRLNKTSFHMVMGNHEHRITRAANESPALHGKISVRDLKYEEHGWKVTQFKAKKPLELCGVEFAHFVPSGIMGRPLGGKNQASSILRETSHSTVVGHTHTKDMKMKPRGMGGKQMFALVAGNFSHKDHGLEGWCSNTSQYWWHGIVMLEGVCGGDLRSHHFIEMDDM